MKKIAIAVLFVFALCLISSAQDKSKRPSPPEQAQCKFSDGKTITVDYSSPRAERTQSWRRSRSLRTSLAYRRERSHYVCNHRQPHR